MRSAAKSPPRLEIAATADGVSYVMADSVSVSFVAADVFDNVLMLLACYFALDLCYPRAYQLCSFLNVHVLKQSMTGRKSSSFVKLEKQISLIN